MSEHDSEAGDREERLAVERALRDSNDRQRFLVSVSDMLASSLDYEKTVATIARATVPFLADGCQVSLIQRSEAGTLRRLAVAHVDPAVEVLMANQAAVTRPEELPETIRPLLDRLFAGESILVPTFSPADLAAMKLPPELQAIAVAQATCSYLVVPLTARGEVLGWLSLTASGNHSRRHYDERDLDLARDVARRAAMTIDNALLVEALHERDRRKDRFLATLGHELRNPLAATTLALENIESAASAEEHRAALAVAKRQTAHQARLVGDLIDMTRLLRGRIEIRREPRGIRSALADVVEIFRPIAIANGQRLEIEMPADDVWALVDPTRFDQIVGNLIDNACKHTRRGGTTTCSLTVMGEAAVITISDDGPGLTASEIVDIFDPFIQLGRRHERPTEGLGLGLTIVRELVVLHGGTVDVSSAGPGLGATFTVTLPTIAPLTDAAGSPPPESKTPPDTLRILVIDDNEDAADMLRSILSRWGHAVEVAYSGKEAIASAERIAFDVAFVDIGMPEMDGYETARTLREGRSATARLIALTGYAQPSDIERALAAGFDEHVAKPVSSASLRMLLAAAS